MNDPGESGEDEMAWVRELDLRIVELDCGEARTVSLEEANARVERRLAAVKKGRVEAQTPRQRLRETLEANRREMKNWPRWMRDAPPLFFENCRRGQEGGGGDDGVAEGER